MDSYDSIQDNIIIEQLKQSKNRKTRTVMKVSAFPDNKLKHPYRKEFFEC